jgi:hypothetical protein
MSKDASSVQPLCNSKRRHPCGTPSEDFADNLRLFFAHSEPASSSTIPIGDIASRRFPASYPLLPAFREPLDNVLAVFLRNCFPNLPDKDILPVLPVIARHVSNEDLNPEALELPKEILCQPDVSRESIKGRDDNRSDFQRSAVPKKPLEACPLFIRPTFPLVSIKAIDEKPLGLGKEGYVSNLYFDAVALFLLLQGRDPAVSNDTLF